MDLQVLPEEQAELVNSNVSSHVVDAGPTLVQVVGQQVLSSSRLPVGLPRAWSRGGLVSGASRRTAGMPRLAARCLRMTVTVSPVQARSAAGSWAMVAFDLVAQGPGLCPGEVVVESEEAQPGEQSAAIIEAAS